jgi:hypothetical protein
LQPLNRKLVVAATVKKEHSHQNRRRRSRSVFGKIKTHHFGS